ncbi:hypothetical protein ACTA71_005931 [Dictyostelium dimigraforme]
MLISKPVKNVFLMGETGSGKSSFINLITNYCRKGELRKLKISIPTKFHRATEEFNSSENDITDSKTSKTTQCMCYTFDMGDFILNIIDSPGLNDTRGPQQDEANIQLILKTIADLGEISAIVIIVNGTTARLTVNLNHVLVRIKGNLPDSVVKSLCFVLTNCWDYDSNFDLSSLQEFLKPDNSNVFYVNNSIFSSNPTTLKESAWKRLQKDWDDCMNVVKDSIAYIKKVDSVASIDFKRMKESRSNIQTRLHEVKLDIARLLKVHDEIIIAKAQLKGFLDNEQKFKNYTTTKQVDTMKLVDAPYHSTICSTCDTVCHDRCGLQETTIVGNNIFQGCYCMTPSGCRICVKKCSFNVHYHARKTMQKITTTMDTILHDIKANYDSAVQGTKDTQTKINTVENSKKTIEAAIKQKGLSIVDECNQIKSICTGFNFVDELNCLIQQMKMESAGIINLEVRNQSDEFIKSLVTLVNTLSKGK